MENHVMEKLAYDKGQNLCGVIRKQKVHIELDVFNMDDAHTIQNTLKKWGYVRTGFILTSDEHIKMDFEKE